MRSGNLLLVVVCGAAVARAAAMAWRWRDLPVVVTRVPEVRRRAHRRSMQYGPSRACSRPGSYRGCWWSGSEDVS